MHGVQCTHVRTRAAKCAPPAGSIVSLSLGSDTVMELRQGQDHRPLLLPRRSLLVLGGESRCGSGARAHMLCEALVGTRTHSQCGGPTPALGLP